MLAGIINEVMQMPGLSSGFWKEL